MTNVWMKEPRRLLDLAGTSLQGRDHLRTIPTQLGREVVWQSFSALYWFERILSEHKPASVLELGTLNGGLTVLFGLHCPDCVVTVDLADCAQPKTRDLHRRLGVKFLLADVFGAQTQQVFAGMPRPRLVFCDDGDKPREFATFAPQLEAGEMILVHDVGAEFFPEAEATRQVAQACGLVRLYEAELLADGTILAAYRKDR